VRHSVESRIFTGNFYDLLVIGTEGDEGQSAEDVLRIHDEKLAAMGIDPLVRGAIDTYRKKHFGTADPLLPRSVPPKRPQATAAAGEIVKGSPPQRVPSTAEQATAAVAQAIKPAAPSDRSNLCEKCGEAVSESQAKLSRLLQNKTLCKKCFGGGA